MNFVPILPFAIIVIISLLLLLSRLWTTYPLFKVFTSKNVSLRTKLGHAFPWFAFSMSIGLIAFSALRPVVIHQKPLTKETHPESIYNFFLVVDSSPSMRVKDDGGTLTRIEQARKDILDFMNKYPYAHYSLITYSHSAQLNWPLSDDNWTLSQKIRSLNTYDSTTASDVYRANPLAPLLYLRPQISYVAQYEPTSENYILYFSTGDPLAKKDKKSNTTTKIPRVEGSSGGIYFLYGTKNGGKIIAFTNQGKNVYVEQDNGPMQVGIDKKKAQELSTRLGLDLVQRTENVPIQTAFDSKELLKSTTVSYENIQNFLSLYWILALISLITLFIALFFVTQNSMIVKMWKKKKVH